MEWVIIAGRVDAKVFEVEDGYPNFIKKFNNSLGREKNKSMTSDRPGMSRGKFSGAAPHALTGERDMHELAADQFARRLSNAINKELKSDHELRVKIVAEPHFLGKVKKYFTSHDVKTRVEWIGKDLTKKPSWFRDVYPDVDASDSRT